MSLRLPITYRPFNSGGHGGQHSNKTLNAMECKVTLPDGRVIKASSTIHKCQHRNRKLAEKILLSRVRSAMKPARVRPDLSERVRTYHAVDNRVVDHASGERRSYVEVMEGRGFDELVDARRRAMEMKKFCEDENA